MNEMTPRWTPRIENDLLTLPCTFYRGGTSKGPAFLASDLPPDPRLRNRVILAALNSSHPRQIDGIGGAETHSNKVVIVSKSRRPDADVDYKFLQFYPGSSHIGDDEGTCGNMSTVVGPFALEMGLVAATDGRSVVRIFAVDSNMLMSARVETPGGRVSYRGDARVAGVDGTAAPVELTYLPPYGKFTGKLLPTGNRQDEIDGVPVTIVDAGGGVAVIFPAAAIGRTGYESAAELDADDTLVAQVEPIRAAAVRLAGMNGTPIAAILKPIMVAPPTQGGTISARDLTTKPEAPHHCHPAHSASGAVKLALAQALPGTVPFGLADVRRDGNTTFVALEHPSGTMNVSVEMGEEDGKVDGVSALRTCRKLFRGEVCVPVSVLDPV
ncbi:PrpF domain-containing protein [Chelativorans xinjiangense]|uniref:PrpF domain-containing protein n=1 Tax=Chelativorans xinjiangense TaxID=2681485 RepID=UPI00135B40CA|nr:PrpF domain-containing protein [Chelativorans xinjiangense]